MTKTPGWEKHPAPRLSKWHLWLVRKQNRNTLQFHLRCMIQEAVSVAPRAGSPSADWLLSELRWIHPVPKTRWKVRVCSRGTGFLDVTVLLEVSVFDETSGDCGPIGLRGELKFSWSMNLHELLACYLPPWDSSLSATMELCCSGRGLFLLRPSRRNSSFPWTGKK